MATSSIEQLEVPNTGEGRVPECVVERPRGGVPGVTSGSDSGDVHPAFAHVGDRAIHQPPRDPKPLVRGIDGDHVDDAHALVERVQRNRDEPDGPLVTAATKASRSSLVQLDRTASA